MKKIIVAVAIVLLMCLFMFSGCSSDETAGQEETNQESAQTETAAEEKGPFGSTQSAKESLLNVLSKKDNVEYLVEYDVETETFQQTQTGGSVKQIIKTMQTIAQKNNKMKIDSVQNINEVSVRSIFYVLDDGVYICSGQDDNFGCFGGTMDSQSSEPVSTDSIQDNAGLYPISDAGIRTIAGEKVKCYNIMAGTAAYDDVVMTGCYTDSGVPLYIKVVTAEGYTSVMEAKKYQKTVSDSEFELPVEPVDLSKMFSN